MKISRQPEFWIILFSFLLHFVWEFLQVPTYAGMAELPHWEGVLICVFATLGDVGFALVAFWIASLAGNTRLWIMRPGVVPLILYFSIGLGLTIGFEYYYINITGRWTYSELMPLVPPFGTGLSPLMQWLIIPTLVLWLSRRAIGPAKEKENHP